MLPRLADKLLLSSIPAIHWQAAIPTLAAAKPPRIPSVAHHLSPVSSCQQTQASTIPILPDHWSGLSLLGHTHACDS